MNWLAHLFLAAPDVESRLGNLLGDLVKGKARETLSPGLKQGLECHQVIDIFTDCHPIVRNSKQRIDNQYRRFSGILIDVFYDHILAKNWADYSSISLEQFTQDVYTSFEGYLEVIPPVASKVIQRAISENWLLSYRDLEGIELSLKRISWKLTRRSKKHYDLCPAIEELSKHYRELEQDFTVFFPELMAHIDIWNVSRKGAKTQRGYRV
ncbi:MAG: ACP phosphodiesterase [Xenococcaceae cyanobacterium MO_207.B15]|nr:ACP phosphodiesterase [Xenococcaceae cyanobacterium MO_207.B15]